MSRLTQIGPEHARAASGFCGAHPEKCTYVAGWLHDGGLERGGAAAKAWMLAELSNDGAIVGLVYISETGILLPILRSESALEQLVALARVNPGMVRVLVGERATIAALWRRFEGLGLRARISRDQLSYSVDRASFRPAAPLGLSVAGLHDLDEIVQASAEMAREEAGDDPQARNPRLFRERIRLRLTRERDFVFRAEGRFAFKCNIAALSSIGGQLEGVFTTPGLRHRGFARAGTSEATAWILERAARSVLLVNEDNVSARALYESLGYVARHDSRTIFVEP